MKSRHSIRIFILSILFLLQLIPVLTRVQKENHAFGWHDLHRLHNDSLTVMSIVEGSGEYVSASVLDEKALQNLEQYKDELHHSEIDLSKYDQISLQLGIHLPFYPEGNIMVGNYDRDPAIEVATYRSEFWKYEEKFPVVEIQTNGKINLETSKSTLLITRIVAGVSNIYSLMIILLLSVIILMSWIVELMIYRWKKGPFQDV